MAMYQAKDDGRNAYRFFDEGMNVEAVEHLFIRNGLRRALDRNEFVLHYQPQIDLRSGAVIGVEALIRWNLPEEGMMAPNRFIPVAEESGLIVPIGDWVLREACRQAVAWRHAGLPVMTVAVNLSAVQFRRGDIEQSVVHALQETGLDPTLLELELTESILIQNVDSMMATITRLKSLGVKISIDDFGTGYSSLSYLKRIDIDKLKIDQSFVRDLATDPDDAAIVRAIIQMAHSLNLRTVAEGVETPQILQQLCDFECDEAQGYHFARPMPANELANFLRQQPPPRT
jgi:EAL domain-containing protein (putative c-di-GMP-specific phosphodiesterase class I)